MKNLKLSSVLSWELDLESEEERVLLSAFDVEQNRVFFGSSAKAIYTLQLPSSQIGMPGAKALSHPAAKLTTLEPGDCIVAMDYLMEKEALVLGTSDGCLILYNVEYRTTEVVGMVDGGVNSISSSPDGALLAVTAGLGQLLVMTQDWEVLYETSVDQQLFENVITGNVDGSFHKQFSTPISWRGDGKFFATLDGFQDSPLQKLRIWERESGVLHSASEAKSFMGASLDWMPSGAKVAVAYDRKAEDKCPLIVFFEKNGLERSYFAIDESVEAVVKILRWNCSSDLLAAAVSCNQYDAIKIWSFSNNHWYLKQEIRYLRRDAVQFIWDPTKPFRLICWTQSGKITTYNFVWMTAVTETSNAFVIDNSSILVSPLALSLMPPPMSLFNLKFCGAVQDIAFFSKNSKNHLAAFLSDGGLCVIELPKTEIWEQFEGEEFGIEACECDLTLRNIMHLTWLDSHILLGVSCYQSELTHGQLTYSPGYYLHEIELVCSEDSVPDSVNYSGWNAKISKSLSLECAVVGIVSNPAKRSSAFIQMDGGSIVEYSASMSILKVPTVPRLHEFDSANGFSSSCCLMKAVLVCDSGIMKTLLFGLDDQGRLQAGRRILCSSCSSFSFYSSTSEVCDQLATHLLFTTKQDLLFIISIDDILRGNPELKYKDCTGVINKEVENTDYINIWERGAKLISVIHGDEAAVILQTSRGNLECIYPRKLVLVSIINALSQRRFKDAMLMIRRHRIDFNIIVDYCGSQHFLKLASEFVLQVNNLGHITEFVCSIKNENVMNTLYKNYISLPLLIETSPEYPENSFGTNEKVSSVLLAVRRALEEQLQESPARELCILTTLARSEPPALEEALNRIKVVREMELMSVDDARRKLCPSSEDSLKHLLWLTDSEAVFEAALGLYDLNLAAIVALNSQKDPKEFLPFLEGLKHLPPIVMKYTIDLRLCRYKSALKHIASAGDGYYEDCINLMKNNPNLFPLGLQLFADHVKRRQVQDAWGDHLVAEKCFEDAATAFLCCASYQKALKAYRASSDWKGIFTVAGILKLTKPEILQLANELCEEFQALGKPAEAARIALEYCADVSRGVGCLMMAREWEDALRIAVMHEREDLASDVRETALECATTLLSEYKEGSEKVGKYLARYLAVRQRRLVLAAKIQNEDRLGSDAEYDNASQISSSFSEMSAYTTRTTKLSRVSISSSTASKARDMRRQRKKGGTIRAGSPGEEMALVEHIKGMYLSASVQRELKSLVMVLVMMGKEETARELQSVAGTFQLSQQAAVKLTEETIDSDVIDENNHTLDSYMKKLRVMSHSQAYSWQSKVLLSH